LSNQPVTEPAPQLTDSPSLLKRPSPAVVAQAAVQRLPRWALIGMCVAYVLAGWLGRDPWKGVDVSSLGLSLSLARGESSWLAPAMGVWDIGNFGLLPIWLSAACLQLAQSMGLDGLGWDAFARVPYALALTATLVFTWYACYYLARQASSQPVGFAFGGEAEPVAYARTVADGGLLALLSAFGLAYLSHQSGAPVFQQACAAALLLAHAAAPFRARWPRVALVLASVALALSHAPWIALLMLGLGAVWVRKHTEAAAWRSWLIALAASAALVIALTLGLGLSRTSVDVPHTADDLRRLGQLALWFVWPTSAFAAYAVWKWRKRLSDPHLSLPIAFALIGVAGTVFTSQPDRVLMLALPALACVAAFCLPALGRSTLALLDWFAVLFFTGCAVVIWVVWFALQTGVPAKPAANVARLAPGFAPEFTPLLFALAVVATSIWAWLVWWRTSRHRDALWKSVAISGGGAVLSWALFTTLWLPLLDYDRSYRATAQLFAPLLVRQGCVVGDGLTRNQTAAIMWHAQRRVVAAPVAGCPYWMSDALEMSRVSAAQRSAGYRPVLSFTRPGSKETLWLLEKP
jgi:hypothetical protein